MAFDLNKHEPRKLEFFATRPDTGKQKRKSRAQEDRVAKLGGGFRQAASGAARGAANKGDVRGVGRYLLECKQTDATWIYLAPTVFSKIEKEAATMGKKPAVQIDIDGRRGSVTTSWWLVPRDALHPDRRIPVKKSTKGSGLHLSEKDLVAFDKVIDANDGYPGIELLGKKRGRTVWVAIPEDQVSAALRLKSDE